MYVCVCVCIRTSVHITRAYIAIQIASLGSIFCYEQCTGGIAITYRLGDYAIVSMSAIKVIAIA